MSCHFNDNARSGTDRNSTGLRHFSGLKVSCVELKTISYAGIIQFRFQGSAQLMNAPSQPFAAPHSHR